MSPSHLLMLLTCGLQVMLGSVALRRSGRSALAAPFAVLNLLAFSYNFADLAAELSGDPLWDYLDFTLSPWTAPITLQLALIFTGRYRALRPQLMWFYGLFGALSVTSASAFVSEWGRGFAGSPAWDFWHIGLVLPTLAWSLQVLRAHLASDVAPEETLRTRLMIATLVLGGVMGPMEILLDSSFSIPSTLPLTVLLAVIVFRFRFLGGELEALIAVYATAVAGLALLACLFIFQLVQTTWAVALLTSGVGAFTLVQLSRQTSRAMLAKRQHVERLALFGQLAAQMAHDLKNPLAAVKGAAQYLQHERSEGRSIDDCSEFLELLVQESDRLSRLIDKYARLGKLQPTVSRVSMNELVQRAVSVQRVVLPDAVTVDLQLASELAPCDVDADLVMTAIESLLTNAREALGNGGRITVTTSPSEPGEPTGVALTIEDNGPGMDARAREQAFDEFFTTKATGSGLGLPMVRRVVGAHGGSVRLTSSLGGGTRVRLVLPGD